MNGWYLIEEDDSFKGVYEEVILGGVLPWSNFNFEIGESCSKYLDFWSNRSLIFVDGRYLIEEEECFHGLY